MLALGLILVAMVSADDYVGRWNVRITDGDDTFVGGWFKVEKKNAGLAGSLVWRSGSAGPAKTTEVAGGTLRLVREEQPGKADVFEAQLEGATLKGQVRYPDGKVNHFEGKRAPELAAAGAPKWGSPVTLFDGKTFQDLKLHLEFNVEPHSNSGVYLRGRYEIQILDDPSKVTEEHGCGALYSRIAPKLDATRPAGEWQTFDITLVGRRLTVVLNGKTIIGGGHVDGITGGAINPFEGEPGPLMLQGDHGK